MVLVLLVVVGSSRFFQDGAIRVYPMREHPADRLRAWLAEARASGVRMPEAATLSTASGAGVPSARTVSVKRVDERGLAFGTSLGGRKAAELGANPHAALTFWWEAAGRQVRAEGRVEAASRAEAEKVWAERGRANRLAAIVSRQGKTLDDRRDLEAAYERADAEHGDEIPCPLDWGVYRLVPGAVEFWQEDERRLIERELFTREGDGWTRVLLQP
jgi:pyridoxamine 5'-phosphate oxidase